VRRPTPLAAALTLLLACAFRGPPESVRALPTQPAAPQAAPQAAVAGAPRAAEQLDELVARVALYPDALLALVLPAATQPTQIFEAARFLETRKRDPQLTLEGWDEPSVISTVPVIRMMNGPELDAGIGDRCQPAADVMERSARARARRRRAT
jgi:hypothetical protein